MKIEAKVGAKVVARPNNSSPFEEGEKGEVVRVYPGCPNLVTVKMDCHKVPSLMHVDDLRAE